MHRTGTDAIAPEPAKSDGRVVWPRNAAVHAVTPIIELTWWQKLVFPDMNFAMYVYHHLHPGVSFSNLPKVHQIYKSEGLVNEAAVFHGQGEFLQYLIKK